MHKNSELNSGILDNSSSFMYNTEVNAEDLYTEVLRFFGYDSNLRKTSAIAVEENNEDTDNDQ